MKQSVHEKRITQFDKGLTVIAIFPQPGVKKRGGTGGNRKNLYLHAKKLIQIKHS